MRSFPDFWQVERRVAFATAASPERFSHPMSDTKTTRSHVTRRLAYALAFAALCAALVAAIGISSAGAIDAKVMGETKHTPRPACAPKTSSCSAIGRVTGYMIKADGKKHPFNVFKDGSIVAWAINLSKPKKDDRNFFSGLFTNERFGGHPAARISVLKAKSRHKYKLVKQSPAVDLKPSLGRKPIFTLNKPLRVRKGQVIALTTPTWVSALGLGGGSDNQWRASRRKSRCNVDKDHPDNIEASRPHQNVGSVRPYGCVYDGGRILYWAYFVPKKK
jgi:hypothetical protein